MNIPTAAIIDTDARLAVLEDVLEECRNQEARHYEGAVEIVCSDPRVPELRKLPVLAKAFGNLGAELHRSNRGDKERLYNELIQVAALAVAWAESLKEGK
jgi:hypothetical protein